VQLKNQVAGSVRLGIFDIQSSGQVNHVGGVPCRVNGFLFYAGGEKPVRGDASTATATS